MKSMLSTWRCLMIVAASCVVFAYSLVSLAGPPRPDALARDASAAQVGDFVRKLCNAVAAHGTNVSTIAPLLSPSQVVESEHYSEFLFENGAVESVRVAKDAASAGPAAIQCKVAAWPRLYVKDLENSLGECSAMHAPLDGFSTQICTFSLPLKRDRYCDIDATGTLVHGEAMLDLLRVMIKVKSNHKDGPTGRPTAPLPSRTPVAKKPR